MWDLVICFLFFQITIIALLLLPFISVTTWRKYFLSRVPEGISRQANLVVFIFLGILFLLFIETVREPSGQQNQKGTSHSISQNDPKQPTLFLFGLGMFNCLIIYRLVTFHVSNNEIHPNINKRIQAQSQHLGTHEEGRIISYNDQRAALEEIEEMIIGLRLKVELVEMEQKNRDAKSHLIELQSRLETLEKELHYWSQIEKGEFVAFELKFSDLHHRLDLVEKEKGDWKLEEIEFVENDLEAVLGSKMRKVFCRLEAIEKENSCLKNKMEDIEEQLEVVQEAPEQTFEIFNQQELLDLKTEIAVNRIQMKLYEEEMIEMRARVEYVEKENTILKKSLEANKIQSEAANAMLKSELEAVVKDNSSFQSLMEAFRRQTNAKFNQHQIQFESVVKENAGLKKEMAILKEQVVTKSKSILQENEQQELTGRIKEDYLQNSVASFVEEKTSEMPRLLVDFGGRYSGSYDLLENQERLRVLERDAQLIEEQLERLPSVEYSEKKAKKKASKKRIAVAC